MQTLIKASKPASGLQDFAFMCFRMILLPRKPRNASRNTMCTSMDTAGITQEPMNDNLLETRAPSHLGAL